MRIRFLQASEVILDPWHPASGPDKSVLRILGSGRILNASVLREDPDSRIITDDPKAVCRIIGIAFPDRQVFQEQ